MQPADVPTPGGIQSLLLIKIKSSQLLSVYANDMYHISVDMNTNINLLFRTTDYCSLITHVKQYPSAQAELGVMEVIFFRGANELNKEGSSSLSTINAWRYIIKSVFLMLIFKFPASIAGQFNSCQFCFSFLCWGPIDREVPLPPLALSHLSPTGQKKGPSSTGHSASKSSRESAGNRTSMA